MLLETLPVILLGICSIPNNNFSPFNQQQENIMIPQLLIGNTNDTIENEEFAKKLHVEYLKLTSNNPHKYNSYQKMYLAEKLKTCWKVWISVDRIHRQNT